MFRSVAHCNMLPTTCLHVGRPAPAERPEPAINTHSPSAHCWISSGGTVTFCGAGEETAIGLLLGSSTGFGVVGRSSTWLAGYSAGAMEIGSADASCTSVRV